ncbi:MAG: aspartate kinase [Burkholderiales bacterium]
MLHVVKLGGSLLDAPDILRSWLRPIAGAGGRLVVVPGGGPFADAVRIAQQKTGIDDRTAHRMALVAMEQYGLLLSSLAPSLVPVDTLNALRDALGCERVPVWMPSRMVADAKGIDESWEVTSDSLAAWLARELGAAMLWLVKSCAVAVQDARQLAELGVVDDAFPRFVEASDYAVQVLGPGDVNLLTAALHRRDVTPMPAARP